MKQFLALVIRWTCIFALAFTTAFLVMHFGRRTPWYKEHLYTLLVTGDASQRLRAASGLAQVEGQEQLLRALKVDDPGVHEMARRALEHLWFSSAGQEAYDRMEVAYAAAEIADDDESLKILNVLTAKFPGYAEAWNRRAAVLWQKGEYQRSLKDCERALAINPNHYGALQGIGICQIQLGEVAEACRSLRAALKIAPHDDATRRSLQKCEELLRSYPAISKPSRPSDLL